MLASIENHVRSLLPEIKNGVVAAVSGGLDSMVMLHLLHLCEVPLIVAHVNYGKRGAASDADHQLVLETCTKLEVPCHVIKPDPGELEGGNFQSKARAFRYAFFHQVRLTNNLDWVATAHHHDDQIETQVLKLFRGESFKATQGIKTIDHHQRLFRPLIDVEKQVLHSYAQANGITWREDASNAHATYARNLLRVEVFPKLDERIPGWRKNIIELVNRNSVADELIQEFVLQHVSSDRTSIQIVKLKNLSAPTRSAVIHAFIQNWLPDVTAGQIKEIDTLLSAQPGKQVRLNDKLVVWRNREELTVQKRGVKNDNIDKVIDSIHDMPWKMSIPDINVMMSEAEHVNSIELKKKNVLWLNKSTIKFPLKFRRWIPADTIRPYGMKGNVLVSDLLVARKIRPSHKSDTIVVTAFDGKNCAVIFPHPSDKGLPGCIHHDYRITDVSNGAIKINIEYPI